MIAQIKGVLLEKTPTRVVLDVQGLGYEINIPVSTYEKLPEVGNTTRLLTHLHVREDVLQLYGFWHHKDRELFQMLISVSGVGPRVALAVLSGISAHEFIQAVANENLSILTRVPGIGRKTAQRLIMELKDKLAKGVEPAQTPDITGGAELIEGAVLALVSLGYRQNEAQKIVDKVAKQEKKLTSIEALIKKALQTAVSST
jgi:Holliday junction DNA helicase RuvA